MISTIISLSSQNNNNPQGLATNTPEVLVDQSIQKERLTITLKLQAGEYHENKQQIFLDSIAIPLGLRLFCRHTRNPCHYGKLFWSNGTGHFDKR